MLIRKTVKTYRRFEKTWIGYKPSEKDTHIVTIKRSTVWILFIPIFWHEKQMSINI